MRPFLQVQQQRLPLSDWLMEGTLVPADQGKITKRLQSLFFSIVKGRNKKYESWLTRV